MTPQEISRVTEQANLVGKEKRVRCKYEWDRQHGMFRWNFYRSGCFIGGTATPPQVMSKMKKFVEAN